MQAIFAYLFTRLFIKIKVLNLHTKQIYKYKSLYILFFKRITPERTLAKVYALIVLSQKNGKGTSPAKTNLKLAYFFSLLENMLKHFPTPSTILVQLSRAYFLKIAFPKIVNPAIVALTAPAIKI